MNQTNQFINVEEIEMEKFQPAKLLLNLEKILRKMVLPILSSYDETIACLVSMIHRFRLNSNPKEHIKWPLTSLELNKTETNVIWMIQMIVFSKNVIRY